MRENGLFVADYAVVISFFAVMIAVGIFFGRKQKSMAQFFGGGKQVPWWLSGISFYMCSFSALAFVMYSALAYKYGWLPVTISWLSVPAVLLGCRLFAARWRRAADTSPLEFIERRYGNGMRQGLMWLCLPMRVLDDAFKLLAIGTVVGAGMGFPLHGAIVASGLIILSYTFLGGLWATLVADFIQFFVLMTVVLVLPFLCLAKVGGFTAFIEKVPPGFFSWTADKYTWGYMFFFFLLIFSNLSTSWSMVQRYYSTRSEKDARKVGYFVAVLLFIGPPLFFLPAMTARVFLPEIPPERMNEVYALVCKSVLPAGFVGMVIAAMFSATMSTLAGDYNAVASVLTNDFYKRMIAPDASPKAQMAVARLTTVLVGAAVIGLTFVMQTAQGKNDLFDVTNKMFGVFLPPIAIPMMLGLITRRISRRGGVAGLLGGIAVGLAVFVAGAYWPDLRATGTILTSTCTATFVGLALGTWMLPDDLKHDDTLTRFFEKVNTPSPVLEGPAAKITFWPLVAGGLAFIGSVLIISSLATRPFCEIRISVAGGIGLLAVAGVFLWVSKRADRITREEEEQA
jgi:SSS family transporter